MKKILIALLFIAPFCMSSFAQDGPGPDRTGDRKTRSPRKDAQKAQPVKMQLPQPNYNSEVSLEQTLLNRGKEVRYVYRELNSAQISQIMWAAYGYNDLTQDKRVVPSADNAYSLLLYVVTPNRIYRYLPKENALEIVREDDVRVRLSSAAGKSRVIYNSVFNIIISGSSKEAGAKLPRKGRDYMLVEAGRVCQNVELQGIRMGLGVVSNLKIDDRKVKSLLRIPAEYEPLAIVTLGSLNPEYAYNFEKIAGVDGAGEAAKEEEAPKKVLLIIPEQVFLEKDFFAVRDTLSVAGIDYTVASSTVSVVRGNLRGSIRPEVLVREVDMRDYDGVILIGGGRVRNLYKDTGMIIDIVQEASDRDKVVGAIGRSVKILIDADLASGRRMTGDTSLVRTISSAGGRYVNTPFVVDEKLVTCQGSENTSRTSASEGAFGVMRFTRAYIDVLKGRDPEEIDEENSPYLRKETYEKNRRY